MKNILNCLMVPASSIMSNDPLSSPSPTPSSPPPIQSMPTTVTEELAEGEHVGKELVEENEEMGDTIPSVPNAGRDTGKVLRHLLLIKELIKK